MLYRAVSQYGICEYQVSANQTLSGFIQFNSLQGVSAVHIHSAVDGEPILVWLATSREWNEGVAQGTPGANAPCCSPCKAGCNLIAPSCTPLTKYSSNQRFYFCVPIPVACLDAASNGGTCPWISQGTVLNFHGYNFQQVHNGCLTPGTPGADMIESVPFNLVVE